MAYKTTIKKSDMYFDSERIREIRDDMHPNTIYPGRRNRHEDSAFAKYDGKIAHNKSSTVASTNTPAPKSSKSNDKPIIVGTRKQKTSTLTNEPKTYYDRHTFRKLSESESKSKK